MNKLNDIKEYFSSIGFYYNIAHDKWMFPKYIEVVFQTEVNLDIKSDTDIAHNTEVYKKVTESIKNAPQNIIPVEWRLNNNILILSYSIGTGLKKFLNQCGRDEKRNSQAMLIHNEVKFRTEISLGGTYPQDKSPQGSVKIRLSPQDIEDAKKADGNLKYWDDVISMMKRIGFEVERTMDGTFGSIDESCKYKTYEFRCITDSYENDVPKIITKDIFTQPLSSKEIALVQKCEQASILIDETVHRLTNSIKDEEFKSVFYRTKNDGKEYGYYFNVLGAGPLLVFMRRHGIDTLCDFGCGLSYISRVISAEDKSIRFMGFENEDVLIKIAGRPTNGTIEKKDITKLTKEDIFPWHQKINGVKPALLYFWEPIHDAELAATFINNLVPFMVDGQFIFCRHAGREFTESALASHGSITLIKSNLFQSGMNLYQKI